MLAAFDPRAFDARGFQAPLGGQPARLPALVVTTVVEVRVVTTITAKGACLAPTHAAECQASIGPVDLQTTIEAAGCEVEIR